MGAGSLFSLPHKIPFSRDSTHSMSVCNSYPQHTDSPPGELPQLWALLCMAVTDPVLVGFNLQSKVTVQSSSFPRDAHENRVTRDNPQFQYWSLSWL